MQILVLNGSPRPHGNTAAMVEAFRKGAEENGHVVTVVNVCQKKIAGCLACEYCHQEGSGHERQCVQKDDMQEVYPLLVTDFPASSSAPSTASMLWINRKSSKRRL